MTSHPPSARPNFWAALGCLLMAAAMFQFFGNASHGYNKTDSMFWWWVSQWLDPAAETEHGWLILGLSGWLLWRNRKIAETGDRKPENIWPALGAMAGGLALHAVGFAVQQTRFSIVGFL